ncbi:hypothetical protein H257_11431 [Aphanomyces astaci]|uniref:Uncharacterized protein n=1 Tax=Aphanomyces astaci TaxID=112090 RepID=W4G364_APHAT|nr:hypothetical protein H257_11431 [Aphanomyces astaci]ETV73716.1 hypothetical protein H257_11431 [Aphanomyces astaci]|eukprot:XP_009836652.1 hypothetical protein H257_11431 [Aphanomyces astaci]
MGVLNKLMNLTSLWSQGCLALNSHRLLLQQVLHQSLRVCEFSLKRLYKRHEFAQGGLDVAVLAFGNWQYRCHRRSRCIAALDASAALDGLELVRLTAHKVPVAELKHDLVLEVVLGFAEPVRVELSGKAFKLDGFEKLGQNRLLQQVAVEHGKRRAVLRPRGNCFRALLQHHVQLLQVLGRAFGKVEVLKRRRRQLFLVGTAPRCGDGLHVQERRVVVVHRVFAAGAARRVLEDAFVQ